MSEVFLSSGTQKSLAALRLMKGHSQGILVGHRRGTRYHIEEALSTDEGSLASLEFLGELDDIYDGRIIGLFADRSELLENVLAPAYFGKIFIKLGDTATDSHEAFTVEYDGSFILTPIPFSWDSAARQEGESDG